LPDEFKVDDAARTMLHGPDIVGAKFGAEPLPHVRHVQKELVRVTRTGEDLANAARDLRREARVPGHRASAGEGHMLPCPGPLRLIVGEGLERYRERPRIA